MSNPTSNLRTELQAWMASDAGRKFACVRNYPFLDKKHDPHCEGCLIVACLKALSGDGSAVETPKDSSLVLRICTAYEQGFGQSGRDLTNPYQALTPESEAWNIGVQEGLKRRSAEETSPPPPNGETVLPGRLGHTLWCHHVTSGLKGQCNCGAALLAEKARVKFEFTDADLVALCKCPDGPLIGAVCNQCGGIVGLSEKLTENGRTEPI